MTLAMRGGSRLAAAVVMASAVAGGGGAGGGGGTGPSATLPPRTYVMGFSAIPPRLDPARVPSAWWT
jgi:hypothetical protein